MSVEDIVTSHNPGLPRQAHTDLLTEGVFQIITTVSKYKSLLNRLLNWQQRGNHLQYEKLHGEISQLDQNISKLIKTTILKLKEVNETDQLVSSSTIKKIRDARLVKDSKSVLVEFETAQDNFQSLLAQSVQRKYSPIPPLASSFPQLNSRQGDSEGEASLHRQPQQLVVEANESEVMLNAVVIEEREQDIREIQQQTGEVSEIFKDLGQIVANQGYTIDDIEANIESAASTTVETNVHLTRAAKSKKSSNYWKSIVGPVLLVVMFA